MHTRDSYTIKFIEKSHILLKVIIKNIIRMFLFISNLFNVATEHSIMIS